MDTTEQVVDKATDGLDDSLQKVDSKTEDAVVPEPKAEPTDKEDKKTDDDKSFTADELEDIEEPSTPTEATKLDTSGLNPEDKYIVDNLPLMVARVKDTDGKIKELQVKSWTQLPEDVEFASKRDELAFTNALTSQENRARELQQAFRQSLQQEQTKEFERRENNALRDDITDLQKSGDLPKFNLKPDDPKFNSDPATKEIQKIVDFMEDRNKQYLAEYNQGRPFRHLGLKEAFYLYERTNPTKTQAQRAEDTERKGVADKIVGNRGLATKELKKPTVRPGTRIDQILDRIDREEW